MPKQKAWEYDLQKQRILLFSASRRYGLTINAKTLNVKGDIGVVFCLDGDRTKYNWVMINGLYIEIGKETGEILSIAVKQSVNTNFIFVPKNGKIDILRSSDFETIDSINFEEATS